MNNHQFPYPEDNQKLPLNEEKKVPKIKSIYSRKFTLEEQEDFFAWKRQADSGSADAQLQAGLCYEKAKGVEQSYQLAFHYYKLAADQGNMAAQLFLGMLYQNGLGTEQSYSHALHYYELAAKKGSVSAQILLGQLYSEGKGVQKSLQKAIEYYEKAANQGHPSAYDYLAEAYKKGVGVVESQQKAFYYYQKKFLHFKKEADAGDSHAQVVVGMCYENGEGVEKSLNTAFYYYKLSAGQQSSIGLFHLAECYALGKGTQKSPDKAIQYYQEAALQGYPLAQALVGLYLLENKINEKQAVSYLKLALESGECGQELIASSAYKLAQCYEMGIGVKKSDKTALYYYKLAADQGNIHAMCILGEHYEKGIVVEKSSKEAFRYYQLAEEKGSHRALFHLARCYEYGLGCALSYEKAIEHYTRAIQSDYKKEDSAMRISIIQDKLLKHLKKNGQKPSTSSILEEDSEKLEKKRLKALEKQKIRKNINRAHEFYLTLPKKEIKYPESQELNLSSYLLDRRIDVFKKLLAAHTEGPIHLHLLDANKEEIIVIRDAMIINPRITFFCSKDDYYSLWEAFHQGGYPPALIRQTINENGNQFLGIIFIGTRKSS